MISIWENKDKNQSFRNKKYSGEVKLGEKYNVAPKVIVLNVNAKPLGRLEGSLPETFLSMFLYVIM